MSFSQLRKPGLSTLRQRRRSVSLTPEDVDVRQVTQVENPLADEYRRRFYMLHDEQEPLERRVAATQARIASLEKVLNDPDALPFEHKKVKMALVDEKKALAEQTKRLDYLNKRIAHLETFEGLLPNTGGRRRRHRPTKKRKNRR